MAMRESTHYRLRSQEEPRTTLGERTREKRKARGGQADASSSPARPPGKDTAQPKRRLTEAARVTTRAADETSARGGGAAAIWSGEPKVRGASRRYGKTTVSYVRHDVRTCRFVGLAPRSVLPPAPRRGWHGRVGDVARRRDGRRSGGVHERVARVGSIDDGDDAKSRDVTTRREDADVRESQHEEVNARLR